MTYTTPIGYLYQNILKVKRKIKIKEKVPVYYYILDKIKLMTQDELDLWIEGCINHYKKNSNKVMATNEERIERLELAHSRLFNEQKRMLEDLTKVQNKLVDEIKNINSQLTAGKDLELLPLPDKLIEGKKYSAEITEIIKREDVLWRKMDYTNWEIKLKGKDYIYLAFIKSEFTLEPGILVDFEYQHFLKLKHLKVK